MARGFSSFTITRRGVFESVGLTSRSRVGNHKDPFVGIEQLACSISHSLLHLDIRSQHPVSPVLPGSLCFPNSEFSSASLVSILFQGQETMDRPVTCRS